MDKLMPSLRAWESAAKLIVERENLMAKLESHESVGKLKLLFLLLVLLLLQSGLI